MIVCIIGLGLIGGSLALDLKKNGFAARVIGVDNNSAHAIQAQTLGLVDEVLPLGDALLVSDLVLVATPVHRLAGIVNRVLDGIRPDQVVCDVGSTKMPLLDAIRSHPARARFVATHPMAGTEYSGPEAALSGLFHGKSCVLCDLQDSAPDAVATVRRLYDGLGMRIHTLDGPSHDLHAAYVSHISHIASFALALTVLEKEKGDEHIFEMAGGGFSSTVRLAKSNPDTWIPIFEQNRDNVLDVLDEYINTVSRFRTLLIKRNFDEFGGLIRDANQIKRVIN
jgi:prephenate dehydrogenase